MKLIIVHYHLRPGGVRRVIELAAPHLTRASGSAIDQIVLAAGEADDLEWNKSFTEHAQPAAVEFFMEPGFNYFSEQRRSPEFVERRIRSALGRLFATTRSDTLVWAHNLGIGRNLILARELARVCKERDFQLVSHHHDWWFDNRWHRWREMKRSGFPALSAVADAIFPRAQHTHHFTINHTDAVQLRARLGRKVSWLPNPADSRPGVDSLRAREARVWLSEKLGDSSTPVWILPCRLLRRKNILEALLLARWLRPSAWLVTTGGVSSEDEQSYADALAQAARRHNWRLHLGILAGAEPCKPSMPELLAASEAVLLTSLQEGFGLPYLEATAAGRPLIARAIPNIAPDLRRLGFRFPHCYNEILVPPELFDWSAERLRQKRIFNGWRSQLPAVCRRIAGQPALLAANAPQRIAFGRLTLTAQLEVLSRPTSESWKACAPLNPFLEKWRDYAASGRLRPTPWPRSAGRWLSGEAYARHFFMAVRSSPVARHFSPVETLTRFIESKLAATNLYPLLWSTRM
jgi:glycosyltransferase involved in cell wall biosynthesis